jgi:hypothetical protein
VWLGALLGALAIAARSELDRARGLASLAGPVLLVDGWLAGAGDPGPGVGMVNIASYAGFTSAPLLHGLLALGSLGVLGASLWTWRRATSPGEVFAGLALALMIALVIAPSESAFSLCAPLGLLLLAASPGSCETEPTPA